MLRKSIIGRVRAALTLFAAVMTVTVTAAAIRPAVALAQSGPVIRENLISMYPLTKDDAAKVDRYTKQLKEDLVAVIGASLKTLKPVQLKYGAGRATFAMNRREPTAKGIINGRNPAGPVDRTVPVLAVETADG